MHESGNGQKDPLIVLANDNHIAADMDDLVHLIVHQKQKRAASRNSLQTLLSPGNVRRASTSARRTSHKVVKKIWN